jgi:hypothetical protein
MALSIAATPPPSLGAFTMKQGFRFAFALAISLGAAQGATAWGQYYPHGYGGYGWGGWGGGAQTPQGNMARGMGAYAAGAGYYNEQTAVARSINADTAMRYNEYMYQSNQVAKRQHHDMLAADKSRNIGAYDKTQERLRNNPDRHDIEMGDALNVAVDEIEDPRIYGRTLQGAKAKIGGEMIREIPFRYAPGAITVSIHRLTQGDPPKALMTEAFAEDRSSFKVFGQEIRKDLEKGDTPNKETVKKALAIIVAAEAKADKILDPNTPDRVEVDKYLKSLHGLLGMLNTPALDILLAGVEKHPDANLGQLLSFMSAYNLRFGEAKSPEQRQIYSALYPQLLAMRDEVAGALAGAAPPPKPNDAAVGEFFQAMDYKDLQKKAPAPPPQPGGVR